MKSMKALPAALALSLLALAGAAQADTLTLSGPDLSEHNIGWDNTGLQFTALQNVTLQSFTFANYGAADVIELTDTSNNILHTINFGAGNAGIAPVTAGWQLTAGQTYRLISVDPNNSNWFYASFPYANAHLSVDAGYGMGQPQSQYWFHFNQLTTVSAVPEPETYAMLLAGLGIMSLLAARRRRG